MEIQDRVAIVTGGGNGIGKALCHAFASAGARRVIVADLDAEAAAVVAEEIGGLSVPCDVSREADIQEVVDRTRNECGPIDIFVSNAGVTTKGGSEVPDEEWQRLWQINVMAHVYAARAVLPEMLAAKSGYLVQVSSAAGVLTEIGSAPYSVTKHAVVSYAEWLSITYQRQGLRVSCVCPAGVATDFLDMDDPVHQFLHMSALSPADVATSIVDGMRAEQFLIVPHPEVGEFFSFKGQDYDRWLKNFARLNEKIEKMQARMARAAK